MISIVQFTCEICGDTKLSLTSFPMGEVAGFAVTGWEARCSNEHAYVLDNDGSWTPATPTDAVAAGPVNPATSPPAGRRAPAAAASTKDTP